MCSCGYGAINAYGNDASNSCGNVHQTSLTAKQDMFKQLLYVHAVIQPSIRDLIVHKNEIM